MSGINLALLFMMVTGVKYFFIVFGLLLIFFSCSDKSVITGSGDGKRDTEVTNDVQKCDTLNCKYHNNIIDTNPDYIPPECGKCNGKWNNYRHRDIMTERECYFGKGIKKKN